MSARRWLLCAVVGLWAVFPGDGWAADYPARAIEIVVPYAPGGGTDIMMRQVVKVIEEQKLVPVPVTVANRVGGSGIVGKSYALNRPADGYTWSPSTPGTGSRSSRATRRGITGRTSPTSPAW